ncbi:MAG TPA: DUF748 domain-containing protein, partial [Nitrospira sp.]
MSKKWQRIAGIIGVLILITGIALFLIDEPLRIYAERQFNRHVTGYTLSIGRLRFHPIGLSVDFEEATLIQNEHPDPPVAKVPKWHASIHWRALLHGRLVSDHRIEQPVLHMTRQQATEEAKDDEALQDRGWQEAVLAVYPLKIDVFTLQDADITYADNQKTKPMHLSHLNFVAENIRNVHSRERTYPSSLHLDADIFDSGSLSADGRADFLSEPHFGVNIDVALKQIRLDDIIPLTGRFNVQLRKGTISGKGHVEYSPQIKEAKLTELTLEGVHVDYVHSERTAQSEKKVASDTAEAAKQLANHPEWLLRVDHAKMLNSELGFVNTAVQPSYRVFLTDVNLGLDNFSNQFSEGTAYLKITGKFMGSGLTQVSATFRPEINSPDFDLRVMMVKTRMRSLNDLLRSYGNFDVADGVFSLFTELTVKDGAIKGYIKPLFKDVEVYNSEQDQDKALLQQVYEGIVGGAVTMLSNRPRNEVATQADVSGSVK